MATKIQWTEATWNPVVGCTKISEGCKNCYAIRMSHRLMHIPAMSEKYAGTVYKTENGSLNWTGHILLDRYSLLKVFDVKKPTMFFVNSMSDLFHENIDPYIIDEVIGMMLITPWHTYQVLTKRADMMFEYFQRYFDRMQRIKSMLKKWLDKCIERGGLEFAKACATAINWIDNNPHRPIPNVWWGVSVENQKAADERIPFLLRIPAAIRFLSCEPLLGLVNLHDDFIFAGEQTKWLNCIDWVIVGGESGKDARPMHPDWVRQLRDQCNTASVPFFFKQWGEYLPVCQSGITGLVLFDKKMKHFPSPHNPDKINSYYKIGKKLAGRKLDGQTHDEMPNISK